MCGTHRTFNLPTKIGRKKDKYDPKQNFPSNGRIDIHSAGCPLLNVTLPNGGNDKFFTFEK